MSEQKLTIEQAFRAMFYFLDQEYERTKSDEIGGLLSSLSWEITQGHGPADPGAWQDWIDAVQKAVSTDDNASPPAAR
ncbi:hypothetical protein [Burkholderia seminalis]|uniref:hypothetical protein n=1 Tax=Burkholderia seminalis TaxID=488731 RepID=UPI001453AA35|nr:hypothetical protein [Burkholderia seminalis]MCA8306857.1 hypothetical protein [Burkholderia seminalis]MCA8435446.1 hypothetical protein [Burkholderia seminalis]VWC36432.1 hypothetical protein BSE24067_06714 [Burkholderia seminalis]